LKAEVEEYHQVHCSSAKSDAKVFLHYMKTEELRKYKMDRLSFGDVMREVQFRNIIAQEFMVTFADNLCNLDLSRAIKTHFQKKAELRNVVMTIVLKDHSYDQKIHVVRPESN
jgi:NDP-sugar pyrophosphorylase family protein